ncbi:unnamed protein product [Echinostoma caproni]|uniref:COX6C domain-containing protein n=1 Tax=Echinostoma caproni TaxID=27848 RepID=A0A183B7C0_9TREM|nr:unnamed protein product [Echinostoma caproni]
MQWKKHSFVRAFPVLGTVVVSAFAISYTWNYARLKKSYHMNRFDWDEPSVLKFYKDATSGSKEWKNKRVPRAWEEDQNAQEK